jgi:DNA-binding response OmpR family regulator
MICDRCKEEMAVNAAPDPYGLTPTQRRVFARLKAANEQLVSRETMLNLLYSGRRDPPFEKTVDSHVLRVRRAVGADFEIVTRYGEGWVMRARR